eukprot:84397_1
MVHLHACEITMIGLMFVFIMINLEIIDSEIEQIDGMDDLLTLNTTYTQFVDSLFYKRDSCNIEIISWKDMSVSSFYSKYYENIPFIIDYEDNKIRNTLIRKMCDIKNLLWNFGDYEVTMSSSNTYSYNKKKIRFGDYVRNHYENVFYNLNPYKPSNETWYFFGDNNWNDGEWKNLIHDTYEVPTFAKYNNDIAIAFGLGGVGSGVPFHFHGHGFSEVIYGEKRWFLFHSDIKPNFQPNMTTFYWFRNEYPKINISENNFYECVIKPGQVLYFPTHWYHATLNYARTVFVTAFI